MKLIFLIFTLAFASIFVDGQKRAKKPEAKPGPKVAAKKKVLVKKTGNREPVKQRARLRPVNTVPKTPVFNSKVQARTVGSSILEFSNKPYVLLQLTCEDANTVLMRLYLDTLVNYRIKLLNNKVSHEIAPGDWKELDPSDKGLSFYDRFDLNLMVMLSDAFNPEALEITPGTTTEPTMLVLQKNGLEKSDLDKLLLFFKSYYGDKAQVNQTEVQCATLPQR